MPKNVHRSCVLTRNVVLAELVDRLLNCAHTSRPNPYHVPEEE